MTNVAALSTPAASVSQGKSASAPGQVKQSVDSNTPAAAIATGKSVLAPGQVKRAAVEAAQALSPQDIRAVAERAMPRAGSLFQDTRSAAESTFERKNARLYASQARIQTDIDYALKLLKGFETNRSVASVSSIPAPTAPTEAELALSASIAALDGFLAEAQAAAVDGKVDVSTLSAAPGGISGDVDALVDATRPDELTYLAAGGQVVIEAEQFTANNSGIDGADWYHDGAGLMVATEVAAELRHNADLDPEAVARLDYNVNFEEAGTYYVWVRGVGAGDGDSNSVHLGFDGEVLTSDRGVRVDETDLGWSSVDASGRRRVAIDVQEPGVMTLNMWVREDGTSIDSVLLTKDATFTPTGTVAASTTTTVQGDVGPVDLADLEALVAAERARLTNELSALEAQRTGGQAAASLGGSDHLQSVIEAQMRGLERVQSVTEERKSEFVTAEVFGEAASLFTSASAFTKSASVAYALMIGVTSEQSFSGQQFFA